jgi:hypothetical protein
MHNKQPGVIAPGRGRLSNQLRRQAEIEIISSHYTMSS